MPITPIETGYKPEFALGALYQGINAANAEQASQEELIKQFLANQREQQMQPLDIQAAQYELPVKQLAAERATGMMTPEMVDAWQQGQLGDWQGKTVEGRKAVGLEPFMMAAEKAKAQQTEAESGLQFKWNDLIRKSQDQALPENERVSALQQANVLSSQLMQSPNVLAKMAIQQSKDEQAMQRVAAQQEGAEKRANIGAASREQSANIYAQSRKEVSDAANKVKLEIEQRKLAKAKDMPPAAQKSVLQNYSVQNQIEDAVSLFDQTNGAGLGAKNYLIPDEVLQRTDPEGARLRQIVQNLTNAEIKNTSGATVTKSEWERLGVALPRVSDSPDVIRQKLMRMHEVIDDINSEYKNMYSAARGYVPQPEKAKESLIEKPKLGKTSEGTLSSGVKFKVIQQ